MSGGGLDPPRGAPPDPDDEARVQRGDDPHDPVGGGREPEPGPDPDPDWQPDDDRVGHWRAIYDDIAVRHRPHREDVLPYLLVRAFSPGDRGQRPVWPPMPSWESPDILLIDADWTGPFDTGRLVASPTAGRAYRVFIRVWNLGLLPAIGVHVRAWWVQPGFFGPQNQGQPGYEPTLIGGAMVDLDDRTRPGAQRVVELDRSWSIPADVSGHECLTAVASCPADQWSGEWASNGDRRFAQRNLTVLAGQQDVEPLLGLLGELMPWPGAIHVTHGGPAAGPLLEAAAGGRLLMVSPTGDPFPVPVRPAPLATLRHGHASGNEQHLVTLVADRVDRTIIARSDLLAALMSQRGQPDPFQDVAALPGLLLSLDHDDIEAIGASTRRSRAWALPQALTSLLDLGGLPAAAVAASLGGPTGAQHLLRFTLIETGGRLVGGYSVVVS